MPQHGRKSDEQRLADLERQKAALDARRSALRARISKKARAIDTRRKILLGSLILNRMEPATDSAHKLRTWLQAELPGFLTRQSDHDLFDDLLTTNKTPERHTPGMAEGPPDDTYGHRE